MQYAVMQVFVDWVAVACNIQSQGLSLIFSKTINVTMGSMLK